MENLILFISFFLSLSLAAAALYVLYVRKTQEKAKIKASIISACDMHHFDFHTYVLDKVLDKDCRSCAAKKELQDDVSKRIKELLEKL